MKSVVLGLAMSLGILGAAAASRADEVKVPLKDVPKAVLEGLKARFPEARVTEAVKGAEDGEVYYGLTIKAGEKVVDVTLSPAGKISEIETEIAIKDLPKPVAAAIKAKYPRATIEEASEFIEIEDGKETKTYEVSILTGRKKGLDVSVSPEGKILEVTDSKED